MGPFKYYITSISAIFDPLPSYNQFYSMDFIEYNVIISQTPSPPWSWRWRNMWMVPKRKFWPNFLTSFSAERKSKPSFSTYKQGSVSPLTKCVKFDIVSRCFENKNNDCCQTNFSKMPFFLFMNPYLATLWLGRPGSSVAR